jgi:hypothetical protein
MIKESVDGSLVFDWLAYDAEETNPLNQSVPQEVYSVKEALDVLNGNPELAKVGIYIAHEKSSEGGFGRVIMPNPNTKDLADPFLADVFNSDYQSVEGSVDKENMSDFKKAANLRKSSPSIFQELVTNFGNEKKSNLAANMGSLGF